MNFNSPSIVKAQSDFYAEFLARSAHYNPGWPMKVTLSIAVRPMKLATSLVRNEVFSGNFNTPDAAWSTIKTMLVQRFSKIFVVVCVDGQEAASFNLPATKKARVRPIKIPLGSQTFTPGQNKSVDQTFGAFLSAYYATDYATKIDVNSDVDEESLALAQDAQDTFKQHSLIVENVRAIEIFYIDRCAETRRSLSNVVVAVIPGFLVVLSVADDHADGPGPRELYTDETMDRAWSAILEMCG